MTAKETTFKGHKVLEIGNLYGKPFSLGLAKARIVVENIEALKKFVQENPETATADNTKPSLF